MNLNNLNTPQPFNVSLSAMCIQRLIDGDPVCEISPRTATKRTREWIDLDGNELSDREMIKLTGLSRVSLLNLWRRYDGDCLQIIPNHGKGLKKQGGRNCSKYRDRDGKKSGQIALHKSLGITRSKLKDFFEIAEFDHVKAHELIDEFLARGES